MKFDRQLRPATETSWVVSHGGKTIPRWRTAAILKITISPYLSEKSSDFHDVIKKWKSCIGQTPSSTERISCSKTTTLLPSAKCTRPLFQGRTSCGGRPSGWHDIVTCQRLVFYFLSHQNSILCQNKIFIKHFASLFSLTHKRSIKCLSLTFFNFNFILNFNFNPSLQQHCYWRQVYIAVSKEHLTDR